MFPALNHMLHLGQVALASSRPAHFGLRPSGPWNAAGAALLGIGPVATIVHGVRRGNHRLQEEERLRRETTAYLTLDLSPAQLEQNDFARLLCRTIATRSSFARAAMLLPDPTGALVVAGSAGMDDLSLRALDRWGTEAAQCPNILSAAQTAAPNPASGQAAEQISFRSPCQRVSPGSFRLALERRTRPSENPLQALNCGSVFLIPLRSANGLAGALAVCATPRPSVLGRVTADRLQHLLEPLEALALRLTLQLASTPFQQKPLHRPHLQRISAERGVATSRRNRRRHADRAEVPAAGSSPISPRQLALLVSASGSSVAPPPNTTRKDHMVGFPSIRQHPSLPGLQVLLQQRTAAVPSTGLHIVPALAAPASAPAPSIPVASAVAAGL